jgi:sugar diacid utilization regulator
VTTVADLIAIPRFAGRVEPLAEVALDREVRGVALIEEVQAVVRAPSHSLVVATQALSRDALGYRLDMLLRRAAARDVSALAVVADAPRLGRTTVELAGRARVALLRLDPGLGLEEVVAGVQTELTGGLSRLMARAGDCLEAVESAERARLPVAALAARVEGVLGTRLDVGTPTTDWLSTPLLVDGLRSGALSVPARGDSGDVILRLLLHCVARAAEHVEAERQRAAEVPVQTRAELLTELLAREPQASRDLLRRARELGIPIDGWHVVARLELENLAQLQPGDEMAAFHRTQLVARIAMESARSRGGTWNRAGWGSAILLVHSQQAEPDPGLQARVAETAEAVIGRVRARIPAMALRCGIGGVHVGATGLRTSALEARAALAAALAGDRRSPVVRFDSTGLRRVLLQWYALDDARDSVARMLEPLDRLAERKSREAIRTLRAYLDSQCSLSRTAEALGVHRNTVGYRVTRILELLGVDPEDPEQRLMLQLACRAREL